MSRSYRITQAFGGDNVGQLLDRYQYIKNDNAQLRTQHAILLTEYNTLRKKQQCAVSGVENMIEQL